MKSRSLDVAVFAALEKRSGLQVGEPVVTESVLITALLQSATRCDQIMQRRIGLTIPASAALS